MYENTSPFTYTTDIAILLARIPGSGKLSKYLHVDAYLQEM